MGAPVLGRPRRSSSSFGRDRRGTARTAVAFGQNAGELKGLISGRVLGPDAYGEIAYEIASPARGLILEILARAGVWPEELVMVR